MKTLKKATIEELEAELLDRKLSLKKKKEKVDVLYNKFKDLAWGHCLIYWKSGGSSLAVFGNYQNGERWFACSNWTGAEGEMTVTSLRDYILEIKNIEQIRKSS